MPKETETPVTPSTNSASTDSSRMSLPVRSLIGHYIPSPETLSTFGWQASNFVVTVATTSTAIALVQNPLNGIVANLMRHGTVLAPVGPGAGRLAAVRGLYAALGSSMVGSSLRTTYVTGAKKATAEVGVEEIKPEVEVSGSGVVQRVGLVSAISFGDLAVTKIPATREFLHKLHVIPDDFKMNFYNFRQMAATGFFARYSGGLVSFSALCLVEGVYARYMPFSHESTRHFAAGAASGMTAAVFAYPFSYYADSVLYRARLGSDGRLQIPGLLDAGREVAAYVREVGFVEASKKAGRDFLKQAPVRMARTGLTFAIVAGVSAALGSEPLASIGFFAAPKERARVTEMPEPEQQPTRRPPVV
ncbi:hypothetical protein [Legionella oakridgensis]|uniref:Mitochondrial carrier protein n=2 Tax=Legionella oakridgensis TaxID=29423 RepID=W0BAG2_9GAMM|nr:hypothetical protein [Legionella oakridgensis]AHE65612.1 hypothetical protein Loa_00021 [Legionella oakridgensis ATCC 33761 = DSM 21215]ETO94551.1 hypothetical protein LOR_10c01170 [Legionella oakridgensis RV-2-2007]KTD38294.1 periplasmic ligand-binding sensor domain protein [Legionella oakridgensis]STY15574.1 periplasmic ligand-binding sensor domain protein [Legionella longbeachae]